MSPFEQQVADALREARQQWRPEEIQKRPDLMDWLAPRVAAAIEAAKCSDCLGPSDYHHAAALEALRGARRAPAETPE